MQFDLKNASLSLPVRVCGQMFLIAAVWNSTGIDKQLSAKTWPFQVTCEKGNSMSYGICIKILLFRKQTALYSFLH